MADDSKEKSEILEKLEESITQNQFVKITLGKYRGTEEGLENIYIEPILLQDDVMYSVRYKYKTKDIFKNHSFEEAARLVEKLLGKEFLYAALYTTRNDTIIEYNKRREPKIYSKRPTFTKVEISGHNRIKPRFISAKSKYLNLLGITARGGEVKSDKYYKFRQIDKFIEIT